jgi:pyruvate/2-oxoacid:ferredoxin oxidoreductase alpha subunit
MQQGINQQLIDAARGQYGGYTNAPMNSLSAPMAALGAANMGQQTSTATSKPGLLQYLTAAFGGL